MESPAGQESPQPARDGFTTEDTDPPPHREPADSEESRVASVDTPGESSTSLLRSSEETDSHGDEFTNAQDNPVVTEFLPINGEIKKMGVEISEEQAEQLKNDIRRLSPEVVSLRERTLGEISLTPDSSFHKSNEDKSVESTSQSRNNGTVRYNLSPIVLLDRISQYSPQLWQAGKNSPETNSPKTRSQSQAEERMLRINSETVQSTMVVGGNANEPYLTTPPSRRTVLKITVDESNAKIRLHRDVPVMVISNERHGSSVKCGASIITDAETKSNEPSTIVPPCDEASSDAATTQSKSLGDDPQSLKAVIRKLGEDEEVIFSSIPNQSPTDVGSCVAHVQAFVKTASPSSVDLSNSLNQKIQVSEIKDDFASADIEMDTETDSDSSEVMASMSAVHLTESRTNNANDTPGSEDVSPEILTRLEPEQPDAFTEDSAESLALTATARDEVRSDGSDSGLGGEISGDPGPTPAPESDSETSFLDRIPDEILSIKEKAPSHLEVFEHCVEPSAAERPRPMLPHQMLSSPTKSNLKRRLADCIDGEPLAKRLNVNETPKKKRNIQFDAVTVYYFPRAQGFTCVPSQGGSTLGMSAAHTHAERFSLSEHAAEQRRIHRARLAQLRTERAANNVVEAASSSEDPSDDTDEEPSDTDELDIDSYYFLLPVPTWQRRALLRAAGVQKIDTVEKDECRDIRASRKHCGCGCKGYCDPESCPCSRAHVKCQVDRAGFPCGCSRDGCANSSGRIEFNPVRVRTHFIHTLMRLELEKKQREEDNELAESQRATCERRLPAIDSCNPSNAGFTTLHYTNTDAPTSSCQTVNPGIREDSLDLYAIRDDCYPNDEPVDEIHQQQRKLHPEFNQAFQTFPVTNADSPVFRQTNYHQDYQAYQQLPSTSRAQFQAQFQSVADTQEFSHYGTYQPNHFPQDDGTASQYANLNAVHNLHNVQQMGKLEPFSELLAGRYSYYGEVESQHQENYDVPAKNDVENNQGGTQQATDQDDCDDNFGEIIKKSMVETVSA